MPFPPGESRDIVLLVDDVPANLAVVTDALEDAGYMVLVATDGTLALERIKHVRPDAILLDAVMPGLDGFETCRQLKLSEETRWIPVVFMTGLTETEDIVRGFQAGGVDYVIKPIKPDEVIARISAHISNARLVRQTRDAMERAGQAILLLTGAGAITWQTRRAGEILAAVETLGQGAAFMEELLQWFGKQVQATMAGESIAVEVLSVVRAGQSLDIRYLGGVGRGEYMLLMQEGVTPVSAQDLMRTYPLTQREAEVLLWVAKGKTNRDIAEILAMSPRTVNKHLEHIFVKLGVETRTAAAALVNGSH